MVTPHERSGRGPSCREGAPPPPPPTCDRVEHKVFVLTDRVHQILSMEEENAEEIIILIHSQYILLLRVSNESCLDILNFILDILTVVYLKTLLIKCYRIYYIRYSLLMRLK